MKIKQKTKSPFFLILVALCTVTAFGQDKQKVTVWVEGKNTDINTVVSDQLVKVITSNEKYIAIERSADFLRAMANEAGHINSGNLDDSQVIQLGKQLGASLVCVAKVSQIANTNYVSARLINMETAQVVATANIYDDFKTIDAIINSCEDLAYQLLGIKSKSELAKEQKAREQEEKVKQQQEMQNKLERERGYTVISRHLYVQMSDAAKHVTYKVAENICKNSRIGGFSTWRLPTIDEMPIINSQYERLNLDDYYWTSSDSEKNKKATFSFGGSDGYQSSAYKNQTPQGFGGHSADHANVRCVCNR